MHGKRRRGGGPHSAAGKAIASRNALRHGFAAKPQSRPQAPEPIESLARAVADADTDPAVVNQAFKIAENELLLAEIAMHKVSVVERLRERYAAPFTEKDNSLDLCKARFLAAWLAEQSIKARLPAVLRKYEPKWIEEKVTKACADLAASLEGTPSFHILCPDAVDRAALIQGCSKLTASRMTSQLTGCDWRLEYDDIVPVRLKAMLEEREEEGSAEARSANALRQDGWNERNDYEALEAAVPDLVRLDRYEQRAWSRQKRAIRQLACMKLERRLAAHLNFGRDDHVHGSSSSKEVAIE